MARRGLTAEDRLKAQSPEAKAKRRATAERKRARVDAEILALHRKGMVALAIATKTGASPQRVRNLIRERGSRGESLDLSDYLTNPSLIGSVRGWPRARKRPEPTAPLYPEDFTPSYVTEDEWAGIWAESPEGAA